MTKEILLLILLLTPIKVVAEAGHQELNDKPNTYKECIKKASDKNSKWIAYKDDVNECRAEFGVPGEY